jgi:Flp pilus assembly protein TadB
MISIKRRRKPLVGFKTRRERKKSDSSKVRTSSVSVVIFVTCCVAVFVTSFVAVTMSVPSSNIVFVISLVAVFVT